MGFASEDAGSVACVSVACSSPSSMPLRNSLADAPRDRARLGSFLAPNTRRTMIRMIINSCEPNLIVSSSFGNPS